MIKYFVGSKDRHWILLAKFWYYDWGTQFSKEQMNDIIIEVQHHINGDKYSMGKEHWNLKHALNHLIRFCDKVNVNWKEIFIEYVNPYADNCYENAISVILSKLANRKDLTYFGKPDKELKDKIKIIIEGDNND